MKNLVCYKTMPEWDFHTFPKGFRKQHNTKVGTWAKLTVLQGELKYYQLDEDGNELSSNFLNADNDTLFIEPQEWHKVQPISEDLRCQLYFYCRPEDYFQKKYKLSATHSEMAEIINYIQSGKALDIGCGNGRNALFLQQQGFDVTAFDKNPVAIEKLQKIIDSEGLEHIQAAVADAHGADYGQSYDLIINMVMLMFLRPDQIADIIVEMQANTQVGGYNLIVCAVDSEDYPLSAHALPFGFAFQSNELKDYYTHWNIKKYNENVGHLHRLDAEGNPIALRFATLIAQKTDK